MSFSGIKPQTTKELAHAYGVSTRTINNWLSPFREQIGPRIGHVYTPKQVAIIYEALGHPTNQKKDIN
jgi:hypothetical protein